MNMQQEDEEKQKLEFQFTLLQEREDFLSVINHRLRTPVLANKRTAQLLLDGAFGPLSDEQLRVLGALLESNNEIDRLLGMLVDLYKYKNSNGALIVKEHSLDSVLLPIQKLRSRAENRQLSVEITVPAGIRVLGDSKELAKLLAHLIENAIKFAKTKVLISASVVDNGELQLSIEDDGIGIAGDDLSHIFERFYLMSAKGKYSPMTGIGLCLCAEIARAHNGRMHCESQLGVGTKFTVVLPGAKSAS